MSARRTSLRLVAVLAGSVLLAACAVEPAKAPPRPATVIALPKIPAVPLPPAATPAPAVGEPWSGMVSTFVLHDCADAPLINAREAFYTRRPAHFENLLQRSAPLMVYVQKQLQAAGIPGEFVMLPMLESSYDPAEASHHNDAAGMWQLMPATARLRGVRTSHHYDGRRDPVASTKAAITMLTNLHRRFKDWRLVDMAYNAGPYAVTVALRKHPNLGNGPIPDIPVNYAARKHLAKLMALSCILRDPGRFHVALPKPSQGDALVAVRVPAGTRLADAADMAGVSEATVRQLNPGYLGHTVPASSPRHLLLPASAAQALLAAVTIHASEVVAQVSAPTPNPDGAGDPPLPLEPAPPPGDAPLAASAPDPVRHYRVRRGDTLWSIAHHYHVSVRDLERWNHLDGTDIRLGEELRVAG